MPADVLTRATGKASSLDLDDRSFEVVLATETPVRRRGYDGEFDEVLSITPASIDQRRIDNLALLDGHNAHAGLNSRLGTAVPGSLKIKAGEATIRVRVSRTEAGDRILRDLEDGHRLSSSVGYRIHAYEKAEARGDGVKTIIATRWQPLELSLVSIPADPTATTRSFFIEEDSMHNTQTAQNRDEQERRSSILSIAERVGFRADTSFVRKALDESVTVDQFRDQVLEEMIKREDAAPTFPHVETRGMNTRARDRRAAQIEALSARMTGAKPSNDAREFMGFSLKDHARLLAEDAGHEARHMSENELFGIDQARNFGGMHTTSDFPELLSAAGERVLMTAYETAESPIKRALSRETTASDFRAKTKLKISDMGRLERVNEAGEVKSTTRATIAESYRLESFARIFSITRQALVNDDIGAFSDWNRQAGEMAAQTENAELLALLLSNPTMGEDNQPLFAAPHNNLMAEAALSKDSLSAARLLFREQTAPGGTTRIGAKPKYLLVGPELETKAEEILATIVPATIDAVNPFSNRLELLVEPNITDASWYVFADPQSLPVLEHAYLAGQEGPQLAFKDAFEKLGFAFRVHLDFGCGAIDFRGAVKNPGE